jgi:glycosyltransferase involved in cell wall biosynthesis
VNIWQRRRPTVGFVSTRIAGTDGVSLEAKKWVEVLEDKGCLCVFMAGELDTDPEKSYRVPEAHFQHPDILEIQDALFVKRVRTRQLTDRIHALKEKLKDSMEAFHRKFGFDILVVQNALAIPVHVPLGLALTEFIAETGIPTICHHHDFYWERQRFHSFAGMDYIRAAFPPMFPNIHNVVINSIAGHELARRTGASWTLIPNVLDFKTFPAGIDDYSCDFRQDTGIDADATLILQPTRVVARKGIETAIELVRRLDLPKAVLVISHGSGDEGHQYHRRIEDYASFMGVDLRIIADRVADSRGLDRDGRKTYTLWDIYPHADLVTYPSTYEGYGNAFVEAIYFRKPVVVNRYAIFEADIEPKGFNVIALSGFVTEETVNEVREILRGGSRLQEMAETNYMLGWRFLSYEMLEEKLDGILTEIYGS